MLQDIYRDGLNVICRAMADSTSTLDLCNAEQKASCTNQTGSTENDSETATYSRINAKPFY